MSFFTQSARLVWFDGMAGLTAGVVVLMMSSWLAPWYDLPVSLLLFTGGMNLVYGSYSSTLARRSTWRTPRTILALIAANALWSVVCVTLVLVFFEQIHVFGAIHLLGEACFVGGLAVWEWRWREALVDTT